MRDRPNILFIVADDLNAWIGPCGGHAQTKTPALDRLAARGTTFSRAYCTAPYCNASRMSVFTGCLPTSTGIYSNEPFWDTPSRHPVLIETLRAAGYVCHGAGKVFHGVFDYAETVKARLPAAPWREVENRPALWDSFDANISEPMPSGRPLNRMFDFEQCETVAPYNFHFDWGALPDHLMADMPDQAVVTSVSRFLENPPAQPFFCAAGLYKPHLPWYVPQRFFALHPLDDVVLPFVKADDLDDVPAIAQSWVAASGDHARVQQHGQWRPAVQAYLAAISYCDAMVAAIMDALDRSPARDNTLVVLWGDNGFHLGEKLHWRKFVLWEEATRVPLIIVPPGGMAAAQVHSPVSLVDIFPTLIESAALTVPGHVDGRSLLPLISGRSPNRDMPAITTWLPGNHSVRQEHWRYTQYRDGTEELYDRSIDPYEWNNLADAPHLQRQIESLRKHLPDEG